MSKKTPELDRVLDEFNVEKQQLEPLLTEITKAPHAFGSSAQRALMGWIEDQIQTTGASFVRQPFSADTPNPEALFPTQKPIAQTLTKSGANIYALNVAIPDAPCVIALATHFDTKDLSYETSMSSNPSHKGFHYLGANDSGSSTAALLSQIRFLRVNGPRLGLTCDIIGIFFDGEEAILPNWNDGETIHPARMVDHTYGSRHAASRLTPCSWEGRKAQCLPQELGGKPLIALIVMDMIGSPQIKISRDSHSTPKLWAEFASVARILNLDSRLGTYPQAIEDDHTPFLQAGVPALDVIDFENLESWHQESDVLTNISYESIGLASKLALFTAVRIGQKPQVF